MIDRWALLRDLQDQVRLLERDLLTRLTELEEISAELRREHNHAVKVGRTAATWAVWRDERVTQAAVAWVLGTVFVRFCEDNGLFGEARYLAEPDPDRAPAAERAQREFCLRHRGSADRDWLLAAFDHLDGSPAGRLLSDSRHNPAYQIPVSHDAAAALIAFWRRRDAGGALVHDFTDPDWDTHFFGDLYQDLSEGTRKSHALLQTPEFVAEFILNFTLTPAISEFGFDDLKVIDPVCGSGHFLLGMFQRLVSMWDEHGTTLDRQEIVRRALAAVHGVDINPFAVAVTRFRLLVAALRAAGLATLAPVTPHGPFPIQVAVGDSLLRRGGPSPAGKPAPSPSLTPSPPPDLDGPAAFRYATEDLDEIPGILDEGRYHVVVGNPPYLTVKDRRLDRLYRQLYPAGSGRYPLSVPFAQRFFELTRKAGPDGGGAGYVGQITANSFMKREFGRDLVERYFATQVELTHVIDTAGAYIPGHGTPTVILIGRRRGSPHAGTVRTVMAIAGEPHRPANPEEGHVWRAIRARIDLPGSEDDWVSVADIPRGILSRFPWNLTPGGATSVIERMESAATGRLRDLLNGPVGRHAIIGDDEVFTAGPARPPQWTRLSAPARPLASGDGIRDWQASHGLALWPYGGQVSDPGPQGRRPQAPRPHDQWLQESPLLWPYRAMLRSAPARWRARGQRGPAWYEYAALSRQLTESEQLIAFAAVATHNHFMLSCGAVVHDRQVSVLALGDGSTRDDHLRLLGLLNSSTACFWLKQVSHSKGGTEHGGRLAVQAVQGAVQEAVQGWEQLYEFAGSQLPEFPLPQACPLDLARKLDSTARQLAAHGPAAVIAGDLPTAERLAAAKAVWDAARARMIALQEELDWQVYRCYHLIPEDLVAPAPSVPGLRFGERAFEIVLARRQAAGGAETQWFARHGATPVTSLPEDWPREYREVVQRRIEAIESDRHLALVERPEHKRRWATEGWDRMRDRALRHWLLERFEDRELWYAPDENGEPQPRPLTATQLADLVRGKPEVAQVAGLYAPGRDLPAVVAEVIGPEHVPYLAAARHTESGLAKRAGWETVWDLQRQQDAARDEPARQRIRELAPAPPLYGPADFRSTGYWRSRGRLDVPRERFISYPYAGRREPSLLIGWAGWDHREQAQVLAVLAVRREVEDGWGAERLVPLLAGLRELLPWVRQWHGEFDPRIGDSPAEIYATFLTERMHSLHLTERELAAWRPPRPPRSPRSPREPAADTPDR